MVETSSAPQRTVSDGDVFDELYNFIDFTGVLLPQKYNLEICLEEACMKCPNSKFNILERWKISSLMCKTLCKMIKDIFF